MLVEYIARQEYAVARTQAISLITDFHFDIALQDVKGLLLVGMGVAIAGQPAGLVLIGVDDQPLGIERGGPVVAAGGVAKLTAALKRNVSEAAGVLMNLALQSADTQAAILSGGALPLLVAMLSSGTSAGQEEAAGALMNMTDGLRVLQASLVLSVVASLGCSVAQTRYQLMCRSSFSDSHMLSITLISCKVSLSWRRSSPVLNMTTIASPSSSALLNTSQRGFFFESMILHFSTLMEWQSILGVKGS